MPPWICPSTINGFSSVPASSTATMRCTVDLAGLGVDFDDREMGAERERRLRSLEVAEPDQRLAVGRGDIGPTDGRKRRAGDVERAGIGVEHDVFDGSLQQVGGAFARRVDELARRRSPATNRRPAPTANRPSDRRLAPRRCRRARHRLRPSARRADRR